MMRVRRLTRMWLATLGVLTGGLLFTAAPTLAAPEKPETVTPATGITATTATLHGVLNPKAAVAAKAGWLFLYSTEPACTTGPGQSAVEPEVEVKASPEEKEVTELQPNKQYEFCLVATNELGETTPGDEVPFTTLPAAPEVLAGSESASNITSSGATLNAAVNPDNEKTTYFFEYSTSEAEVLAHEGTRVEGAPPAPGLEGYGAQGASANASGLSLDTPYYYRVIAENAQSETEGKPTEGETESFTTSPTAPLASTGATSEVAQSSANVTGTVTPEGLETHYYYQYGPSTEYGQRTSPSEPGINVGAGLGAVPAPAILVPLTPGVTYHYRLVAWNEYGTTYGQDKTFTAIAGQSPLATTGPASGISTGEATISGTINPEGKETAYRFEYGTNTEYGTQAFGTVLPEQGVQTVTLSLRGLEAGTTYHYRLVVSNPGGEATGADATFTTPPIADPLVNPAVVPLIATPAIAFPAGSQENTAATKTTTKKLTNTQKLVKALKACAKQPKRKRATCEKQARGRYGTAKKKRK